MEMAVSSDSSDQSKLPGIHDQSALLVSVIILFRDARLFLKEAIESVLQQSYHTWELLLIDDGSEDGSFEIASQFANDYPSRVRMLAHEGRRNLGVSASRNLGLRHARGEHVCFLDADDVFLPDKLDKECRILFENPEAAAVCGTFDYWFSWNQNKANPPKDFKVTLGVTPGRMYYPPSLVIHNIRAGGRKPGTSGIMIRREKLSPDVCDLSFAGLGDDQVFWAKLALTSPVFITDECSFKYRQHSDSLCAVAMEAGEDLAAWKRFLDWLQTYLDDSGIDDPQLLSTLSRCRRNIRLQMRLFPLKRLYRRFLPLRTRYWMRDRWISLRRR